jgi:CRISPR-associated protein Csd1
MSEEAVEAYIRAINWLGDKRHENYHYRTSDTIFLFWSDQPLQDRNPGKAIELGSWEDLLSDANGPLPPPHSPLAARRTFSAPGRGTLDPAHADASTRFYCLSLSGSSARAIVRGWIDQPLPIARENVIRWFNDLTVQLDRTLKDDNLIIATNGDLWSRWPLWQLVACLQGKGDSAKQEVAHHRQQLLEMALLGPQGAAPLSLLALAVARIPAANEVTPVRAALIQLLLKRMNKQNNIMKTELNLGEQTVAFHCGRLLRLLQSIQSAALGDTNATIVSRFYTGASAMPGGVFGTLLSKSNQHLNKLRGDKPKLAGWFDVRIAEVVGYIVDGGGFPATNDPVAQGDFALGFYWQRLATKKEKPEAEPDEPENNETAE